MYWTATLTLGAYTSPELPMETQSMSKLKLILDLVAQAYFPSYVGGKRNLSLSWANLRPA